MPSNPPPGWTALQERARQVKDPRELAAIIDEMNQLLSDYEKAAGDGHGEGRLPARSRNSAKKTTR